MARADEEVGAEGRFAKKDRITHRIPISSKADIDKEVERWLKVAYDEDAK